MMKEGGRDGESKAVKEEGGERRRREGGRE